jgi:cobalt-zinc-cadmium efflux system membrane fusion protein
VPGKNGRLIATGGAVDATAPAPCRCFSSSLSRMSACVSAWRPRPRSSGAAREVVAVPASAVIDESGMATVFVMTGGESFERRQVRVGARDGDWVEVVDGLEPGQRVVSRGAYLVKLAATKTGEIGHGHAH